MSVGREGAARVGVADESRADRSAHAVVHAVRVVRVGGGLHEAPGRVAAVVETDLRGHGDPVALAEPLGRGGDEDPLEAHETAEDSEGHGGGLAVDADHRQCGQAGPGAVEQHVARDADEIAGQGVDGHPLRSAGLQLAERAEVQHPDEEADGQHAAGQQPAVAQALGDDQPTCRIGVADRVGQVDHLGDQAKADGGEDHHRVSDARHGEPFSNLEWIGLTSFYGVRRFANTTLTTINIFFYKVNIYAPDLKTHHRPFPENFYHMEVLYSGEFLRVKTLPSIVPNLSTRRGVGGF